jgi:hypothetical protein
MDTKALRKLIQRELHFSNSQMFKNFPILFELESKEELAKYRLAAKLRGRKAWKEIKKI